MRSQFSLKHLLNGVSKQACKDALFAKEVVETFGAAQLLLNVLNRRHRDAFNRWLWV